MPFSCAAPGRFDGNARTSTPRTDYGKFLDIRCKVLHTVRQAEFLHAGCLLSSPFVTSDRIRPMNGFCWGILGIIEEEALAPREAPGNSCLIRALRFGHQLAYFKTIHAYPTIVASRASNRQSRAIPPSLLAIAPDSGAEVAKTMAQQFVAIDERRKSERFSMRIPVTLLNEERTVSAITKDLSAKGIFFYLPMADSALIKEDFDFIIDFPPELTLCTSLKVRCTGKVVRRENTTQLGTGVAAQIYRYAFLPTVE